MTERKKLEFAEKLGVPAGKEDGLKSQCGDERYPSHRRPQEVEE